MFRLPQDALRSVFRGLLVAALSIPVLAPAQQAQGIYTCTDVTGRKLTSDRPILACIDREQKVLNPSGTIKFKVGPTLTAQELSELETRRKAEVEERARVDEEKRRERALLMRYPNKVVHDKARAEAVVQIALVRQTAVRRVDELLRRRNALDIEMEFYSKNPTKVPPTLLHQLEEVAQNLAIQGRFIADQDAEMKRINVGFDNELTRLNRLWAPSSPTPAIGASKAR